MNKILPINKLPYQKICLETQNLFLLFQVLKPINIYFGFVDIRLIFIAKAQTGLDLGI